MAKTYTAAGSATAGQVYTASAHNVIVTDVNNLIVPCAVSAANSGGQTMANAGWTFASFDGQVYDTDDMFAPTSTTVTINTTGLYVISAYVNWPANATGQRIIAIEKNAATAGTGAIQQVYQQATGALETKQSISHIASLAATDTIKLSVYQNSGGNLTLVTSGIQLVWVGRIS